MSEINSIQNDAASFLNKEHRIDVADQLEFTARLQQMFALAVPFSKGYVTPKRLGAMEERQQDHPDWRIVPAMLDEPWARPANATRLGGSELAAVLPAEGGFWMPSDSAAEDARKWGRLWQIGVGGIMADGKEFDTTKDEKDANNGEMKVHALMYRTPQGAMVRRPDYVASLLKAGQALKTRNGSAWIFPLLDVSDRPRWISKDSPVTINEQVDPVISPEALINLQLIKMIAGRPANTDIVDIANEAVCELDDNDQVVRVIGATGVTNARRNDNEKHVKFIRHAWWSGASGSGDYQLVEGASALVKK